MARALAVPVALAAAAAAASGPSVYDLTVVNIDGRSVSLSELKGNVSVLVNVATY
jgi:cytochrome oxidase Cu insertion factor (SCO1/SenC/PrrC family)